MQQQPTGNQRDRDPRDTVKQGMEQATKEQPSEFRDEANESKRVEIGKDLTRDPIKGIDPET